MKKAAEFIMRSFHARTSAHVLHLQTSSYAEHVALQTFYEELIPLVDSFAEAYIGENGKFGSFSLRYAGYLLPSTSKKLMSTYISWIEENRKEICESSHCQNVLDEILSLAYSTKYKITELS